QGAHRGPGGHCSRGGHCRRGGHRRRGAPGGCRDARLRSRLPGPAVCVRGARRRLRAARARLARCGRAHLPRACAWRAAAEAAGPLAGASRRYGGGGRVSSVRACGRGDGMKSSAVYPGTFDPFTRGHEDIVRRAAGIFARVVVAVAAHTSKTPAFPVEERVELARATLAGLANVEIVGYTGLTVEFARQRSLAVIVRGLRAVSDFEFEFQLANMSRHLLPNIETVFMV